jgi:hypothetical protein
MAELGAAFEYVRDVVGSWLGINEKSNKSMMDSIRLAGDLKRAEQELRDVRISGLAPMARARMEIAKLREALNDETLSNKQRLAILDQALAKEAQLADAEEYLARERFRIAKEQAAINTSDIAAIEEVANAEVNLIAVRENSFNRRRKIGKERMAIIRGELTAERAAMFATLKDAEEFVDDLDDIFSKDTTGAIDAEEQARIGRTQTALLFLQNVEQEYRDTQRRLDIEATRHRGDELTALEMERADALSKIRTEAILAGVYSDEEIAKVSASTMLEFDKKVADERMVIAKTAANSQIALQQSVNNSIANIANSLFGRFKSVAIAQAIIDAIGGASSAYKQTPGGPFVKGLAAASALASGYARVRQIRSVTPGSSSAPSSVAASTAPAMQPSFGVVDATRTASTVSSGASQRPIIVLEGEFDSEFLAIKVRQGSDSLSSRGVSVISA